LTISKWLGDALQRFTSTVPVVIGEGLSHAELFQPKLLASSQSEDCATVPRSILYLGDMRSRKGWYDFFTAVEIVHQQIPNIELWLVSKEPCQIDTRVPFQFIHRPSRAKLAELYATCDLFVSASWWESFGLPPLEAMACGAPVVLTNSGGVLEYARHEENCLLVPPRAPEAIAEAIHKVLIDKELATRLSKNGPLTAKRFTWDEAVNRFEACLAKT
jgi:glycosyltransferase involved in cell wall biosynthesis